MKFFDVIVVGSGHAGVEAAYGAARKGCQVLIVTVKWENTAHMSCNPSIGGVGKGHIVKEIDILGGLMGLAADASCIQFKLLNSSKGPAVRGSRAQCDKELYSCFVKKYLSNIKNISYLSAEVKSCVFEKQECKGIITETGDKILAGAVILTTGTFMRGLMHIGSTQKSGGRVGEKATRGLSDQLQKLGFPVYRLKTGTPPRLKKQSINFSALMEQKGDSIFKRFSFFSPVDLQLPQTLCYLTYTNTKTHNIIRENLNRSALYSGVIKGVGPRYCPSIEDKIIHFSDKNRHQSFLEPETLHGDSFYLQGISTSLPEEIQLKFLRTIKGLEQVEILKPGYAVEYDFLDPQMLLPTLETKMFKNLFFAGQINGSSGYEEAAGQGLVAGINAANKVKGVKALILKRHESYIGVLIDDLVTKGTKEPYRMLTSRAEHRLALREDNVIERLYNISREQQLLSEQKLNLLQQELKQRENLLSFLNTTQLIPTEKIKQSLQKIKSLTVNKPQSLKKFVCRPEIKYTQVQSLIKDNKNLEKMFVEKLKTTKLLETQTLKQQHKIRETWEAVEISVKYEGYIYRQKQFMAQNQKQENILLPNINYNEVKGLSLEALENLKKVRPQSLAQASRMSGISPAAIQAILIYLKIKKNKNKNK